VLAVRSFSASQCLHELGLRAEGRVRCIDASRESRSDLLQEPRVAVRIAEGRKRRIGLVLRMRSIHGRLTRSVAMKYLAHLHAAIDQLLACGCNVGDDEIQAARGTWRGG